MSFSQKMMDKYSSENWSERQKQYENSVGLFKGGREVPLQPLMREQVNPTYAGNAYEEEEDDDGAIKYQWKGKFLYTRGRGGLDPVNLNSS